MLERGEGMKLKLTWNIGQEAAAQGSLTGKPHKAFFYWTQEGQTVRSEDFTASELEEEIERLRARGEEVTEFEAALTRLREQGRIS